MQTVDSDQMPQSKREMKLVRGNREHGNLENTFRTIRCATSEDTDHLPMQRRSDFAICGNKQACKLQFLARLQISGLIHHRFSEGLKGFFGI